MLNITDRKLQGKRLRYFNLLKTYQDFFFKILSFTQVLEYFFREGKSITEIALVSEKRQYYHLYYYVIKKKIFVMNLYYFILKWFCKQ